MNNRHAHTIIGVVPAGRSMHRACGGYRPGSDRPSCGWPAAIALASAVLALCYAGMHVAVAAGF